MNAGAGRTGRGGAAASRPVPIDPASTLVERVLQGDARSVGRALSIVEGGGGEAERIVDGVFPSTGRARVIGITGPPGVGKSTLVDRMVGHVRHGGRSVAVLAVDPSSAASGGALLGDRIRMTSHGSDSRVFGRSMANRGRLGGLARAARPAIRVLDAAGFDVVVVETVGVGQAEIEVAEAADCVVVVSAPGTGDVIQVAKSGVLEVGDVYVVNRADEPGAHGVVSDLQSVFAIRGRSPVPAVVETVATSGVGVGALLHTVTSYLAGADSTGRLASRRERQLSDEVLELVRSRAADAAVARLGGAVPEDVLAAVSARLTSPSAAAHALADALSPISTASTDARARSAHVARR